MSTSFSPAWSEQLRQARKLRIATDLIDRAAPAGPAKENILIRLRRLAADLERLDTEAVCRRCARSFVFSAAWFQLHGFETPRRCDTCRRERRHERRWSGTKASC
jgi:hypothetical protein